MCICITDLLCCTPEINTTVVNQLYSNKIGFKKIFLKDKILIKKKDKGLSPNLNSNGIL